MAPEKDGSRIRRKAGAGRTVEKKAAQGGGVTMVDVDPWGSFFEMFFGAGRRRREHRPAWAGTGEGQADGRRKAWQAEALASSVVSLHGAQRKA
jgi:hypothetical protein